MGLEGATDADTQRQVNANMLGAAVLDVQHYPTATFKINSIVPLRVERAAPRRNISSTATSRCTARRRKIKIVAEATTASGYVRLRGNFPILQTDYGITPFSKAFGAIGVADRLTIWGELWLATGPGVQR